MEAFFMEKISVISRLQFQSYIKGLGLEWEILFYSNEEGKGLESWSKVKILMSMTKNQMNK